MPTPNHDLLTTQPKPFILLHTYALLPFQKLPHLRYFQKWIICLIRGHHIKKRLALKQISIAQSKNGLLQTTQHIICFKASGATDWANPVIWQWCSRLIESCNLADLVNQLVISYKILNKVFFFIKFLKHHIDDALMKMCTKILKHSNSHDQFYTIPNLIGYIRLPLPNHPETRPLTHPSTQLTVNQRWDSDWVRTHSLPAPRWILWIVLSHQHRCSIHFHPCCLTYFAVQQTSPC